METVMETVVANAKSRNDDYFAAYGAQISLKGMLCGAHLTWAKLSWPAIAS